MQLYAEVGRSSLGHSHNRLLYDPRAPSCRVSLWKSNLDADLSAIFKYPTKHEIVDNYNIINYYGAAKVSAEIISRHGKPRPVQPPYEADYSCMQHQNSILVDS